MTRLNGFTRMTRFLNRSNGGFFERCVDGQRSYCNLLGQSVVDYQIRKITPEDIPRIAEIRKAMNLHDCISCLYSLHTLDPEAIIIAEDEEGKVIGTHSMASYVEGVFMSGLTYVHHDYRKKQLAMEMVHKGISRHRNELLMLFSYVGWAKKLSEHLRLKPGFIVKRYISKENVDINVLSDDLPGDVAIHPFEDGLLNVMNDYDLQVVGYERRAFLDLSCNEPNSKTLIAVKNGHCVGFGSIKLTCPGAKRIGPLYADDPKIAEALLKSLLTVFDKGKGVVIVVPSPNVEAQKLVEKLHIPFNDGLHQLYDKEFPQADVTKAYAHFDVNTSSI